MEESLEDTHCPAKPITHAFLQFKTEKDRNGFLTRFKPDFNPEERYLQRQLEFATYYLITTCEIPLNRIRIDGEQQQISVQCMIVVTTKPDGTLEFHKHEAIREQIDEKWISGRQKLIRKTVSSHQKGQHEARRWHDHE